MEPTITLSVEDYNRLVDSREEAIKNAEQAIDETVRKFNLDWRTSSLRIDKDELSREYKEHFNEFLKIREQP
jgi:predicted RNase H-like HicB family nuclease